MLVIASDHAGRRLKEDLKAYLTGLGVEVEDLGPYSDESVDYPDFGIAVAERVSTGAASSGVLVCGTGIGMSIVANKFRGVRAALVGDTLSARMSKEHNNSNIIVIGGRVTGEGMAREIISAWLDATFEGGRHQRRLDKIEMIEKSWAERPEK